MTEWTRRLVLFRDGGYAINRNTVNPADRLECLVGFEIPEWEVRKLVKSFTGVPGWIIEDNRPAQS